MDGWLLHHQDLVVSPMAAMHQCSLCHYMFHLVRTKFKKVKLHQVVARASRPWELRI